MSPWIQGCLRTPVMLLFGFAPLHAFASEGIDKKIDAAVGPWADGVSDMV